MGITDVIKDAIVQVGDGRGFLVQRKQGPHHLITDILTAAHCLPSLPPAHPFAYGYERTYRDLIGPRGGTTTIWAACLFVDPIADVAILGCPDHQELVTEAEAYDTFMESRPALQLNALTAEAGEAWLLTLDDHWERCRMRRDVGKITLLDARHGSVPGTSGSPILTVDGLAVGLVSVSSERGAGVDHEQWGQPTLLRALPAGWLEDLHAHTG